MVNNAQATTAPLLEPLLLLLDDVVGAEVAAGDGVAPGEGVPLEDDDDDDEEDGAGVGDGVVVVESSSVEPASLVETERRGRGYGVRGGCRGPGVSVWSPFLDKENVLKWWGQ